MSARILVWCLLSYPGNKPIHIYSCRRPSCLILPKSSILLGSFTYCTGYMCQSFNGRLCWRTEQEPGRLQKKCRKIAASHHTQVRHSAAVRWTSTSHTRGAALPAEQKAAADPLGSTGFIPTPWAAPALLLSFHMPLMKFGSVKYCSCPQTLLLSPQCKVTQRKIPEAAGIERKRKTALMMPDPRPFKLNVM